MTGAETTDDAALGGRLRLLQPKRGHRFGHDAVLLAAATDARAGEHVVEFGAGVGLATLAVLTRVAGTRATLVEIDPALGALARENAERNGLAERAAVVVADVAALPPLAAADRVLMNPPYNDPRRHRASPDVQRAGAHMAQDGTLRTWCAAADAILKPGGVLTLIWRAEGLTDVLAAATGRFGRIAVLPVHTRAGAAAGLVLVRAERGPANVVTLPGLTLNDPQNRPTAEAERILRDAQGLSFGISSPA
jgi:tRNA1(Val) A37 N6-methylase TrmN6